MKCPKCDKLIPKYSRCLKCNIWDNSGFGVIE